MLRDYCLITAGGQDDNADMFEMHRLVQLATRKWLDAQNLEEMVLLKFIGILFHSFPGTSQENPVQRKALLPHIEMAIKYQPQQHNTKGLLSNLFNAARYHAISQGKYLIAEEMLSRAINIQEGLTGPSLGALCGSMGNLAILLNKQISIEEARVFQTKVIRTRVGILESGYKFPGMDPVDLLESCNSLAAIHLGQGLLEEAEGLQLMVLEMRREHLGDSHEHTLVSMANLASTYQHHCRLDEAEGLQKQVLQAYITTKGEDHPYTLQLMDHLAKTYLHKGQSDQAEDLQGKVLKAQKVKLGEYHPDTLKSMHDLSVLWHHQGR